MLLAMVLCVLGQYEIIDFSFLNCILITVTPLISLIVTLIMRRLFFVFEEFFNTIVNIFMF